jgi:hypothetical protein
VSTAEDAITAADRFGYPVVLKTAAEGVLHKTDVEGVRRGLASAEQVARAYAELSERLGPDVVVQHHATGAVEVALGIVRDPLLGPLVVVATGGTLVEVLPERAVALPPLSADVARGLVTGLPGLTAMLSGVRGAPASNLEAAVDAVVAMGQLAVEMGDLVEAVDVNPLICSPVGATAVDALILPRLANSEGPTRQL